MGGGDRDDEASRSRMGQHVDLDRPYGHGFGLKRPGTEGGPHDPGPFPHQHPQVDLGPGAPAQADDGDATADRH